VRTLVARSLTFTSYVLQSRILFSLSLQRAERFLLIACYLSMLHRCQLSLSAVIGHISLLIFSVIILVMFLRFHYFVRCEFLKMNWLYELPLSLCQFTAAVISTKGITSHRNIFFQFVMT
jgi:hypothetical protein